jgi:hypothetical protein
MALPPLFLAGGQDKGVSMNLRKLFLPFLLCAMVVLSACQGGPKAISEAATQTAQAEADGGTGSNPGDPTVVPTDSVSLTPTIDLTPTVVTTDTDDT